MRASDGLRAHLVIWFGWIPMVVFGLPWACLALVIAAVTPWSIDTVFWRPVCWLTSHHPAYETKWGVQSVCLHCNARLDGGEPR